jgi:hypothetical protein
MHAMYHAHLIRFDVRRMIQIVVSSDIGMCLTSVNPKNFLEPIYLWK